MITCAFCGRRVSYGLKLHLAVCDDVPEPDGG